MSGLIHGTFSAYCHGGCRCDLCKQAKRNHQRRYRSAGTGAHVDSRRFVESWEPDSEGRLAVTCWCERTVVRILVADVRRGLTESCGRIGCFDYLAVAA